LIDVGFISQPVCAREDNDINKIKSIKENRIRAKGFIIVVKVS